MFHSSKELVLGRVIEYNIEFAKDPKNKEIFEIQEGLVFICDLSFGKIYQHKNYKDYWFLTDATARRISDEQLDFFYKWEKESSATINEELVLMLQTIGGIPFGQYEMAPDYLQFPCRAVKKDGQQLDLCILHFSKSPPFQSYFHNLTLLSDIEMIQPSEFALEHKLRISSRLVGEIRMAFAPFVLKTKDDQRITYNGAVQFVSDGHLKGADIAGEAAFTYEEFNGKIVDIPLKKMTYIIGKWDDKIETLFKKYRAMLDAQENSYKNANLYKNENTPIGFLKYIWFLLTGRK